MPTYFDPPINVTPGVTGSWQDVDLSVHCPTGTTGVMLKLKDLSGAVRDIGWRKRGSTDDRVSQGASNNHRHYVFCGVDASRVMQLYIGDANQTAYLCACFGSEAVFFTNGIDVSPAIDDSWEDVDISAHVAAEDSAVLAFLEVRGLGASLFGLRMNGSTVNTRRTESGCRGAFVGLDANKIFEAYISDAGDDIWLLGYLKAGATMLIDEADVTPADGAWRDLAALPAGAIGGLYRLYGVSTTANRLSVRKNGSADTEGTLPAGAVWMTVACDESQIVEGYTYHDISYKIRYQGYFTNLPTPAITSLMPDHGAVGDNITITGTDFGATRGAGTVTFNGTMAAITSWSDTAIVTTVPVGATSGDIVVTNDYGRASKGHSFTVTSSDIPDEPDAWPAYPIYRAYRINSGTIPGVGGARIIRGKVIGSGDADAHYGTPVIRIVDIGSGDFDEHYGAECARIYVIGEGDASGYQGYETTQLFTVI